MLESRSWEASQEYVEEGVSARTENVAKRPLFREAIDDALTKNFDVLVVHKLDRFARIVRVTLESLEKLEKSGCSFVSINEQMDFSTPMGRVILANLAAFGQYYSDNLSAEVSKGLREKAIQGKWNGPAPFGYVKTAGHSLEPVPEEVAAVTRCFEMYATGSHPHEHIATWLNQQGFRPSVEHRKDDSRTFLWTRGTVMDMLRNHAYLGYVTYKGRSFEKKHEPIVTDELFETVQQVRFKRTRAPRTYAVPFRTYLLKGLIRCVHCGEKLWAHHIMGKDYYQDASAQRGIPCPIKKGYVRAEILEERVSEVISTLQLPDSWRELVVEFLSARDEMEAVERERAKLEERLKRIKRQYRDLEIDEHEYKQEVMLAQGQLASLAVPEGQEVVQLGDNVEGLVLAWQTATKEEQHQILQMMLDAVYVDVAEKKVVGLQPKPSFLPLVQS